MGFGKKKRKHLSPKEQSELDNRLIAAASDGNTKEVRILLASGAYVHAQADPAFRALDRAAWHGHTETVKVLLAAGADVHANHDLALQCALDDGHTDIVRILLAHGADVHAQHDTALCCVTFKGQYTQAAEILLAAGADVHARDDFPLRSAAYGGDSASMVRVLARHIFSPDSWRGRNEMEIKGEAKALFDKIQKRGLFEIYKDPIRPEHLDEVGAILFDTASECWQQVRPPPRPRSGGGAAPPKP